jgi:hypothetical protein
LQEQQSTSSARAASFDPPSKNVCATTPPAAMPVLVAGIHLLLSFGKEGVDGSEMPGH